MQCLILAGGRGERMRPLTDEIPKVLLPVAGKPFLQWQIDYLKNYGIKEIILAVGYKAEKIENYFGNGEKFGVKITYSREKEPLGTGGAIKNAENLIKNNKILVLNGDSFVDIDIKKMLEFHQKKKKPITIAVRKTKDVNRYGSVLINKDSIVTSFQEKKEKNGDIKECFINAGVYIFQKKILKYFPLDRCVSLEKEIFPKFVNKITAFKINGYFIDIGIPKDYKKANIDFKKPDFLKNN